MPIMHLNGYKIANPTVLARMDDEELRNLFRELGNEPFFIAPTDDRATHSQGLERTRSGRAESRGLLALASSAGVECARRCVFHSWGSRHPSLSNGKRRS
jgi:hypothetical protein